MAIRETLELDLGRALDQVRELERELNRLLEPIEIPVQIDSQGALEELRQDIRRADTEDIDVDVDTDEIQRAERDFEDFRREVDRSEDELQDLENRAERTGRELEQAGRRGTSAFRGLATGALALGTAFATFVGAREIFQFFGAAIDAASDLAESTSKAQVVFGEFADDIEIFAQTAPQALGLSSQAALEFTATFGNLFTALGLSQEAAADLSPQIVQLGADLASFNNIAVDEALTSLRAGLVGEVEPLRRLGVAINAASVETKALELGLVDVNGELSEAAKVQARYALILEQTTTAQGDFARTADGLANTQRTLTAEWQNAQAVIGEQLVPVLLEVIPVAFEVAAAIGDIAIELGLLVGSLTDAEAALLRTGTRFGIAADSATALLGAVLQADRAAENLSARLDRGGRSDFLTNLTEDIEALVDAFAGSETELETALRNLSRLESEFGLSADAAELLRAALEDKLAFAAAQLSDEVLRARLVNELARTRQAMIDAESATLTEAVALNRLEAAAAEAGVSVGSLLGDIAALPPELQDIAGAVSASTIEFLRQVEALETLEAEFGALPGAMEAAKEALKDEEGEIVSDFGDFIDNLQAEIRARELFESNLAILRAFGLDDLANVFDAAGLEAAGALADAVVNPQEAQRAENLLGDQYSAVASSITKTMEDTIRAQPVTPALIDNLITAAAAADTPEVRQALLDLANELLVTIPVELGDVFIPPNLLEGLDFGSVSIPATVVAAGGSTAPTTVSPGVQAGLTINQTFTSTPIPTTDTVLAAQAANSIIGSNLPK